MKTIIAIAAATLAVPAAAQPEAAPRTPTVAAPAPTGAPAIRYGERTRFCVINKVTGSRLDRRECRTRGEWLRDDYDPIADMKK